jgi:hypothetical protein
MDKSSTCGWLMPLYERELWDEVKETFAMEDIVFKTWSPTYSWYNSRDNGQRVMACLDMIYTPKK